MQVVAATVEALRALEREGGQPGRLARYAANLDVLVEGLIAAGYDLFLDRAVQAPVIATFVQPRAWSVRFETFYDRLAQAGFVIYPGKLTRAQTFRIGCIGQVFPDDMRRLVKAVEAIAAPGRAAA